MVLKSYDDDDDDDDNDSNRERLVPWCGNTMTSLHGKLSKTITG